MGKKNSIEEGNSNATNNEEEINKKDIIFFEISEKNLLNLNDYNNIVSYEENEKLCAEDLSEYYKGISDFCLWKNNLDEMFCIISTLSGGLIFVNLNDGQQVSYSYL